MRYRFMNQSSGYPILSWKYGPPSQTRAAETRELGSLGSLGGDTLGVLPLARPGAPEPVGCDGCANPPCSGPPGPLNTGVGEYTIAGLPILPAVGLAALAYFLLRKKRK